ncbi:MAG: formimidoylglutamase [Bacteroidia bacterium]|nr:formimidoylglutamase [Bacteroidia bacterium]
MYKSTSTNIWKGRVDEEDGLDGYRWHQVVKTINPYREELQPKKIGDLAILGFASDEGVKRNKGRVGAVEGPLYLRKALASMAWHLDLDTSLIDAGDVVVSGDKLEQGQEQLGEVSAKLLDAGYLPIVLGGGHAVAWASFQGYVQSKFKGKGIGIINIDAHFDLRKSAVPSSGTPFLQIANWCEANNLAFKYLCLGIQEYGNTKALFNTAREKQVSYVTAQDLLSGDLSKSRQLLDNFISELDYLYLSIDLDAFDAAFAPGVSATVAGGLTPGVVLQFIHQIASSGKLLMMDIAELNPRLDQDMRTAKLGARCIHHMALNLSQKI